MDHQIKVACSLENLKEVREFVRNFLKEYCLSEEDVHLLVLAVDEVCANVIIHSNSCDEKNFFSLSIKSDRNHFVFEIKEEGKPFDPSALKEPDINSLIKSGKKGGVGLMLVKRIMDTIELRNENASTVYRMTKKVSPAC